MYNQRRQNSATGHRSSSANGSRPVSVNSRPGYLNPTNSSTGHAKGGAAVVLAKINGASANSSLVHKRPPSSMGAGGKPPRADGAVGASANRADDFVANFNTNGGNGEGSRPASAAGGPAPYNFNNTFNSTNGAHSVARTVYRPSAILIDKITHGQHPPLAPIDPLSAASAANSPARSDVYAHNNASIGRLGARPNSRGGMQHDFRPSSTAYGGGCGSHDEFNVTGASNASSMIPPSVGAKDLLRFKESLKGTSPSALAVAESRRQLAEDQERERVNKLEFREQWRLAVEEQLRAKEERRSIERARGLQERTVIEDRFLEEKATNAAKKRQMAFEIQQQKYEDETRAAQRAQEAVERAREERAQMDATVHQMQQERREAFVTKVKTQQEIRAHAATLQQQRLEERMMADAERRVAERSIADAAKEAEVREGLQVRKDQKQRQREVLEQSRALSAIKQLNDSKAQMEYEAALEQQKRMVEDRNAREHKEQLEAKSRLSQHLRQQMEERQTARAEERRRTVEQQRAAADAEKRRADAEAAAEKQMRFLQQKQLQRDLEAQMHTNMNKTLVDLIHD